MRQQSPKRFNPLLPAVLVALWVLTIFGWIYFAFAAEVLRP